MSWSKRTSYGALLLTMSSCALAAGIDGLQVQERNDASTPVSTNDNIPDATLPDTGALEVDSAVSGEAGTCDFVSQSGCDANQTCYYGSPSLCRTAGTRTLWKGCTDDPSSCGPGLVCLLNVCVPQCDKPDKKCSAGATAPAVDTMCVGYVGLTNVGTCWERCDPTATSGCGGLTSGRTCLVIASHAVCGTHLLPTNGGNGASCKDNAECAAGYWCIGDKCVRRCSLSGSLAACSMGEVCKGFAAPFVADGVSLGYCATP